MPLPIPFHYTWCTGNTIVQLQHNHYIWCKRNVITYSSSL